VSAFEESRVRHEADSGEGLPAGAWPHDIPRCVWFVWLETNLETDQQRGKKALCEKTCVEPFHVNACELL
jgi:hypothetical protein